MAGQTLLTSNLITARALARFHNQANFLKTSKRRYELDFRNSTYQAGQTISIRKRNRLITYDALVTRPEPVIEQFETLTLNHMYAVPIEFDSIDLTLKIDAFDDRYLAPAVDSMKSKFELDLGISASQQLNYFVGTAGTPLNSYQAVDQARAKLLALAIPVTDVNAFLNTSLQDASALRSALSNFYRDEINKLDLTGSLGRLAGFNMFESQLVARQVAGNFGAGPITTTATVTSGNQITMTGLTGGTTVFNIGDRFATVGTYAINPLSYSPLFGGDVNGYMQFVVTAPAVSNGAGVATVTVAPEIISDLGNPNRNVNQPIPAGTLIVPLASHNVNVAYIDEALDVVCPPLKKLMTTECTVMSDPETKISIRLAAQGDLTNNVNGYLWNILAGFKWHPEYACVLAT